MVSTNSRAGSALIEQLHREVYRFDLFQAVRLLERTALLSGGPAALPVGFDNPPERESVRFHAHPSLAFPASAAVKVRGTIAEHEAAAPPQARLVVSCLGLTGPAGVLPRHYTTQLIEQLRSKELAMSDFFDLFNHRFVSFFYRAWVKYRLPVDFERSRLFTNARGADSRQAHLDEDSLTTSLYCLIGLGTAGLREQLADDSAPLHYAGYFAQTQRPAVSLKSIISDYLQIPTEIKQFFGQWLYLSPGDCSRLPGPNTSGSANNQLGQVVLGSRVWDVQNKFLVRLGPLTRRQFEDLLPGGDRWRRLFQMVRNFVGPQFDFAVQLVLLKDDVPPCEMTSGGLGGVRLGRNAWLSSQAFERDVTDAIFHSDLLESNMN